MTSPFKEIREDSVHEGLDLKAKVGTDVFAMADGRVSRAGPCEGGAGRCVVVDHLNGMVTMYAHLDKVTVKEGQQLPAGALLGKSGRSESVGKRSKGTLTVSDTGQPHLHIEVLDYSKGKKEPLDPTSFLETTTPAGP